jgi:hypothetical protein
MRIDSSGNLGLGVTPSAWGSSYKAIQNGQSAFMSRSGGADSYLLTNNYYDGTNFRYINTAPASRYQQDVGVHSWFSAPSGTAGNAISFTQAMTLDASGNLLVGKTATGFGTAGIEARSGGTLWATASGTNAASFNRLTNDGDIAIFAKDGATVGSIGNNTDFYIASQDGTGVRFSATQVLPCSESGAT